MSLELKQDANDSLVTLVAPSGTIFRAHMSDLASHQFFDIASADEVIELCRGSDEFIKLMIEYMADSYHEPAAPIIEAYPPVRYTNINVKILVSYLLDADYYCLDGLCKWLGQAIAHKLVDCDRPTVDWVIANMH